MNITAPRPDETVAILQADFVNCWIPLQQTILAAPAVSVSFSSIPQIFRSLAFVIQARTDRASTVDTIYWQANGDAGQNYSHHNIYGLNNAAAASSAIAAANGALVGVCDGANSLAGGFGGAQVIFPNYRSTTYVKQAWSQGGNVGTPSAATVYAIQYNSIWHPAVIAAITSLVFFPVVGPNFVAGSIFAMYGVL